MVTALDSMAQAVATAQHHDAVTGTCTPDVTTSYMDMLSSATVAVHAAAAQVLAGLLTRGSPPKVMGPTPWLAAAGMQEALESMAAVTWAASNGVSGAPGSPFSNTTWAAAIVVSNDNAWEAGQGISMCVPVPAQSSTAELQKMAQFLVLEHSDTSIGAIQAQLVPAFKQGNLSQGLDCSLQPDEAINDPYENAFLWADAPGGQANLCGCRQYAIALEPDQDPIPFTTVEMVFRLDSMPLAGYTSLFLRLRGQTESTASALTMPVAGIVPHDGIAITNGLAQLTVHNAACGPSAYTVGDRSVVLSSGFWAYDSFFNKTLGTPSGSYAFRPLGPAAPFAADQGCKLGLVQGLVVTDTYVHFANATQVRYRLWSAPASSEADAGIDSKLFFRAVHVSYAVGPVPANTEVVVRWQTDIRSGSEAGGEKGESVFYTDNMGLITHRRQFMPDRVSDQTFANLSGLNIAANYYPVVRSAALLDESTSGGDPQRQLNWIVTSSHGGSSLQRGQWEMMLHRRLLQDDGFGENLPLNDTSRVYPHMWLLLSPPSGTLNGSSNVVQARAAVMANSRPLVFVGQLRGALKRVYGLQYRGYKRASMQHGRLGVDGLTKSGSMTGHRWRSSYSCSASAIAPALPDGVHLLTLRSQRTTTASTGLRQAGKTYSGLSGPGVLGSRSGVRGPAGWTDDDTVSSTGIASVESTTLLLRLQSLFGQYSDEQADVTGGTELNIRHLLHPWTRVVNIRDVPLHGVDYNPDRSDDAPQPLQWGYNMSRVVPYGPDTPSPYGPWGSSAVLSAVPTMHHVEYGNQTGQTPVKYADGETVTLKAFDIHTALVDLDQL